MLSWGWLLCWLVHQPGRVESALARPRSCWCCCRFCSLIHVGERHIYSLETEGKMGKQVT